MTGIASDDRVVVDAVPPLSRVTMSAPRLTRADALLALVCAAVVAVAHPWSYLVDHPYWLDEAWVATVAKASLGNVLHFSSSTPVGWLLIVRSVPGGRDAPMRLVPLAFAAASVVAAFLLARRLPWPSFTVACLAGVATALVVALAPIALQRNDLKQYTADAFFSLALLLVLVARIDERPGTRAYVALAAGTAIATVFSTTAAFVGVAAFAAVFAVALRHRVGHDWRPLLLAAMSAAAFVLVWFVAVLLPHDNRSLRNYWDAFYLRGAPWHAIGESAHRLGLLAPRLAMPAALFVALVALGCVGAARMTRPALALTIPLLWLEMFVLGWAQRYPFLDQRTSHFLLISSLAIATIGVTAALVWVAAHSRVVAIGCAVLAALAFVHGADPYFRVRDLPAEDVRAQVRYVHAHVAPGDMILVNLHGNWGFSYYWPGGAIEYVSDDRVANGFTTRVRGLGAVEYLSSRSTDDITAALRTALARRAPGARLWIIRSHDLAPEQRHWAEAFATLGLAPETVHVGREPLVVVAPAVP